MWRTHFSWSKSGLCFEDDECKYKYLKCEKWSKHLWPHCYKNKLFNGYLAFLKMKLWCQTDNWPRFSITYQMHIYLFKKYPKIYKSKPLPFPVPFHILLFDQMYCSLSLCLFSRPFHSSFFPHQISSVYTASIYLTSHFPDYSTLHLPFLWMSLLSNKLLLCMTSPVIPTTGILLL